MPSLPPDKLAYTLDEAAHALGIGRTTLWKMTKAGEIATFQLHGRTLVRRADLEALVDAAYEDQAARRKGTTLETAGR